MSPEIYQQGERDEELAGRAEPQPIADFSTVLPKREIQQERYGCDQRRLPDMVRQFLNHFDSVLLSALGFW